MEAQGTALYLDLLKRTLTGMVYDDPPANKLRIGAYRTTEYVAKFREYGRDMPNVAHTMIGVRRLDNIQQCVETALADGVPGDLIETGVWRGGACIFMRAVLRAHAVADRTVWVADSFNGLPTPDPERFPLDKMWQSSSGKLVVTQETVRANFERYGLLDDQVRFLQGWFKDTLPTAPIGRLAVMRLDGDLYESTMDVLDALYDRLSPGGFIIIDDYNLESCKQAVHDFRGRHDITETIHDIDGMGAFWRRKP